MNSQPQKTTFDKLVESVKTIGKTDTVTAQIIVNLVLKHGNKS